MVKYIASVLMVIAGVGVGSQVHASTSVLYNEGSHFCTGIRSDSLAPGAPTFQTTCDGSPAQQWNTVVVAYQEGNSTSGASPVVTFVNANSGLCLDNTTGPNSGTVQNTCNGSSSQKWVVGSPQVRSASGTYLAVSRAITTLGSAYCLDGSLYVPVPSAPNTTTCSNATSQLWDVNVF